MGAPKNPRRKTPRKNPNMARPPHKNPLALQHKTPEGRAKFKAMIKTRKNSGRPLGVPDGYGKGRMVPIVEQAQKDAKKVVSIMKQDHEMNARAEEALETAVEIMRTPVHNRDRLQAAKLILDFTKVKPVAKQEVTLNNAEAFLSSLLDDDGEQDENPTEETESSTEETV
jgi:hypothetical protein